MKTEFKVKTLNNSFDVYVLVDNRTVSITSFQSAEQIRAAAPALVEKAKSAFIQALAIENQLNAMLAKTA
jgi:hypothetical protein